MSINLLEFDASPSEYVRVSRETFPSDPWKGHRPGVQMRPKQTFREPSTSLQLPHSPTGGALPLGMTSLAVRATRAGKATEAVVEIDFLDQFVLSTHLALPILLPHSLTQGRGGEKTGAASSLFQKAVALVRS